MSGVAALSPVSVVVGNPRPASRTHAVAIATAKALLRHGGDPGGEIRSIDLSELASGLFSWGDERVAAAKQLVLESRFLVVASPVYKASFTGLVKAFLDQFGRDELAALPTVPLMVGAGPAHSLAVEHQLRPVLIEIGASCPTRGLYILEDQLDTLDVQLEAWLTMWGDALIGVASARRV
jgi:FMN reductase